MRALQQLACVDGVADCRGVADAEDRGEMERIGTMDESLFELAVDPQPFKGRGQSPQGPSDVGLADRTQVERALSTEDHMAVGRIGQRTRR